MTATVTPPLPIASLGPGRWLVPSNSRNGKVHIVVESEEERPGLIDGRWACSCEATRCCRHIRRVREEGAA